MEAIAEIGATQRKPEPDKREGLLPRRINTKDAPSEEDQSKSGELLDTPKLERPRQKGGEFRITHVLVGKYGKTEGCPGCLKHEGGPMANHALECRQRFGEIMLQGTAQRERLFAKDIRAEEKAMEAEHRTRSINKRKAEDDDIQELRDEPSNTHSSSSSGAGRQTTTPVLVQQQPADEELEEDPQAKRRRLCTLVRSMALVGDAGLSTYENYVVEENTKSHVNLIEKLDGNKGTQECDSVSGRKLYSIMALLVDSAEQSPYQNEDAMDNLYEDLEFVDDCNRGVRPDRQAVIRAMMEELEFFKKMNVYRMIKRKDAFVSGSKLISTKWVDTNKRTIENPNIRCRLVGREIRRSKKSEYFTATPPLEVTKILSTDCVNSQNSRKLKRVGIIDIRRAYFYAKARRKIHIESPTEDWQHGDEDHAAALDMSLYGTLDAGQNWSLEVWHFLRSIGFRKGTASTSNFRHVDRVINVTVHRDDFLVTADSENLWWVMKEVHKKFEAETCVLGPEKGLDREATCPKRKLLWSAEGIRYEPDPKHASIIMEETGTENSKAVTTPMSHADLKELASVLQDNGEIHEVEYMDDEAAKKFRAVAARANYLAQDRTDLQQACRCVFAHGEGFESMLWNDEVPPRSTAMCPTIPFQCGTERDCHVCRQRLGWLSVDEEVNVSWDDYVWALSREELSSGEAELHAVVRAAVHTKWLMSLAGDFDLKPTAKVYTDSTTALGICHRSGLAGRTRHIQVQNLWVQESVDKKEFELEKIPTKFNVSDILTKAVGSDVLDKHLRKVGFEFPAEPNVRRSSQPKLIET